MPIVREEDCVRYEDNVATAVKMLGKWYDIPLPRTTSIRDFNTQRLDVVLTSFTRPPEKLSFYATGETLQAYLEGRRDPPGVYSGVGVNCTQGTIVQLGIILPIQFNGPEDEPALLWDHLAECRVLQHRCFTEYIDKVRKESAEERRAEMLAAAQERFNR